MLKKSWEKSTGPFQKWVKKQKDKRKKGVKWPARAGQDIADAFSMLNPCKWKEITLYALKCIMAGMDLKTVYLTFIKKTLASLAGAGLEIVFGGLPQDKQDIIMEAFRKEFKDMPMPWEMKYDPGEVPDELLENTLRDEYEKNAGKIQRFKDARSEIADIKQRFSYFGIDVDAITKERVRNDEEGVTEAANQQAAGEVYSAGMQETTELLDDAYLTDSSMREQMSIDYSKRKYDSFFIIEKPVGLKIAKEYKDLYYNAGTNILNWKSELTSYEVKWKGVELDGTGNIKMSNPNTATESAPKKTAQDFVNKPFKTGGSDWWIINGVGSDGKITGYYWGKNKAAVEKKERLFEKGSTQYNAVQTTLHNWLNSQINGSGTTSASNNPAGTAAPTMSDFIGKPFKTDDKNWWILTKESKGRVSKFKWGSSESAVKSSGTERSNSAGKKIVQDYIDSRIQNHAQEVKDQEARENLAKKAEWDTDQKRIEQLLQMIDTEEATLNKIKKYISEHTSLTQPPAESWDDQNTYSVSMKTGWGEPQQYLVYKINIGLLKEDLEQEVQQLRVKLTNLNRTLWKTDISSNESKEGILWSSMTDEQKDEAIAAQRDNASRFYKLEPGQTVKPGTLGKALGNVQKVVASQLIEMIMETATMNEIMNTFDRLPGSKLIATFLATFKCPNTHWVYPPINTFLNTLTFDPCGPGKTRIAAPWFPKFGKLKGWSIFKFILEATQYALRKVIQEVAMALLMKIAKLVDTALCRVMGLPAILIRNSLDRRDDSFLDVVDELICGNKNQTEQDKKKALSQVMNHAGAKPSSAAVSRSAADGDGAEEGGNGQQTGGSPATNKQAYSNSNQNSQNVAPNQNQEAGKHRALATLLSQILTKDQILTAMTSLPEEQDLLLMKNISNVVKLKLPEFSKSFEDEEAVKEFFAACGNLLTPDQRQQLRNERAQPDSDFPIDRSVCLTNQQKEEWDTERRMAFQNAGLSPEVANDYLDRINDRSKSDFADAIDALINDPETDFQNAINDMMSGPSGDPDCNLPSVFDLEPPALKEDIKGIQEGLFKRVQAAFIQDLISANYFQNFIGADIPGILSTILTDKRGFTRNFHVFLNNNSFFRTMFTLDWNPPLLEPPETVGTVMLTELEKNSFEYKFPYGDNDGNDPSLTLKYDNSEYLTWYANILTGKGPTGFKSKMRIYDIVVSNGKIKENFDYKIKINAPEFNRGFIVDKQLTKEEDAIMEFIRPEEGVGVNFKMKSLQNFMTMLFQKDQYPVGFPVEVNPNVGEDSAKLVFGTTNNIMYNQFLNELMKGKDGEMPEAFYYGDNDVPLSADDVTYVDPEPGSTSYTYEEDDKVLGRSLTNNPRVHFLDPAVYGGDYSNPFKYIESPGECGGQRGWMKITRMIVPDINCMEKDSDFLYLKRLTERINASASKIERHEKLDFDPECLVELPYDKIAAPQTLANLEGTLIATIRAYIVEFIITAMPALSNINLDFGKNYDEAVSEYIMKRMEKGCIDQRSWNTLGKWEGHNYWLLLLEQAAQTVIRMMTNGDIESNKELSDAWEKIQEEQKSFEDPDSWVIKNQGVWVAPTVMSVGALGMAICLASGPLGVAIFLGGPFLVKFVGDKIEKNATKWAMKIYSINNTKNSAKTMLKYLIREQLNFYRDELALKLDPRPRIYDTAKYFIGASGMTLGSPIQAGLTDIEHPIGGGEIESRVYGTLNDCAIDVGIENPLQKFNLDVDGLNKSAAEGSFFLEKYIRFSAPSEQLLSQNDVSLDLQENDVVMREILKRDVSLQEVVNVPRFKSFLEDLRGLRTSIGEKNLSEVFGHFAFRDLIPDPPVPPEIPEGPEDYGKLSLTGVKFGVRLCYVPPEGFNPFSGNTSGFDEKQYFEKIGKYEKSYVSMRSLGYNSSKYIFPICSYEQDLPDDPVNTYIDSDQNMNQELKCYIDKMAETPEYKMFFHKFFDVRRVPSLLSIYSSLNFLPSLGLGEGERDGDKETGGYGEDEMAEVFNDTKYSLRRLFVSIYKRKDFDPPDEEDEYDFVQDETKRLLANIYRSVTFKPGEVPWWYKKRIKDKPFDCLGEACGNTFSKLYETKKDPSKKK